MSEATLWRWSGHEHEARPATERDVARTLCGIAVEPGALLQWPHQVRASEKCTLCATRAAVDPLAHLRA